MGARVIACASSDDKLAFAREHGADEGVNYAREDLREALEAARRRARHRRGLRSDRRPPTPSRRCARSAWDGRYLVVGFAAGEIPKLPLNLVLLKSCDVRGVFWGSWTAREPAGAPRQHRRPGPLVRGGQAQRARARDAIRSPRRRAR